MGSSPVDCAVSWLPMYHDMGLVGMAIGAVYGNLSAVLLTPQAFVKRPVDWLRAISRHRGTVSFAPNFAYDLATRRVKESDVEGLDLSCWRVAGCGAEPIHAPTLAAFADKFRTTGFRETSFLPSYGLAEHVLAATVAPRGRQPRFEHLSADDLTARGVATRVSSSHPGQVTVVSCGPPLPGHRIRIADEQRHALPERAVGEISLAGPSVTPGYYKNDALTAMNIRDGWLHTGDLGYLANGELFVCGRVKDVIIINGRKHHAQDLEWSIDDLAGIRRGRVAAFGTALLGCSERAVIVVEPSGTVPAVNAKLGFAFLDTATALVPNLPFPSLPGRGSVSSSPEVIESTLTGPERELYLDHREARAARHLVLRSGSEWCYVVFRRDRRKGLPLFASVLHVSNPDLFARMGGRVRRHLLLRHRLPVSLVEPRVAGSRPRLSVMLREPRKKMVRGDRLAADRIDYLYSELVCVSW